jgi:hypothetical protein
MEENRIWYDKSVQYGGNKGWVGNWHFDPLAMISV